MGIRKSEEYTNLSKAIAWMRFPLIMMIVLLHCYCSIDARGHDTFFSWVYPFGLWMGETGVPAFFFISGLLFFFSTKTYSQKIQSRIKTLLVPYIFWNLVILLGYVILDLSGHGMLVVGRSVLDYDFIDFLRAFIDRGDWDQGNGVPMLCPYWFVRNLMVLCLLSPLLYYAVRYLKLFFVLFLLVWWMSIPLNGMIASSLLFFSLGAYFSILEINPLTILKRYKWYFWTIWFLFFMADWLVHTIVYTPYYLFIHRIALVLNIFMLLHIGCYLGDSRYKGRSIMDKSVFWVFTVHYPLTIVLEKVSWRFLQYMSELQILLYYFISVICITLICVFSYMILHHLFPRFMSFTTGSRS